MKKRLLLLSALMLFCACASNNNSVSSSSSENSSISSEIPTQIENFVFETNSLGAIAINEDGGVTIKRYNNKRGSTLNVVIPEVFKNGSKEYKITRIGEKAFCFAGGIKTVTLSKNIKFCASNAFAGCTSLLDINVDSENNYYLSHTGILYSKDGSTLVCSPNAKEQVETIATTKHILSDAFNHSMSKVIILNEGLETIGNSAFTMSKDIETLNIPDSVLEIGTNLFEMSEIQNVVFGKGLTILPEFTFYKCGNIQNITIPGNIKTLEYASISQNEHLKTVTLEAGVETIGDSAISFNSHLSSINLNEGLVTIGNNAFLALPEVQNIVIPEGTETIGDSAFGHSSALRSITIPSTVKSIGKAITQNCKKFDQYILSSDNPYFEVNNEALFTKDMKRLLALPQQYGTNEISSYVVPSTVESIDRFAFSFVSRVNKVTLPKSLVELGAGVFANGSVKEVVYLGSEEDWNNIKKSEILLSTDGINYVETMWNESASITLSFGEN